MISQVSANRLLTFVAVYDGHCGRSCVDFILERLHMEFSSQLDGVLDKSDDVLID